MEKKRLEGSVVFAGHEHRKIHAGLTVSAVENMKRRAKKLGKEEGIPHHAALNQVAKDRGFEDWAAVAALVRGGLA